MPARPPAPSAIVRGGIRRQDACATALLRERRTAAETNLCPLDSSGLAEQQTRAGKRGPLNLYNNEFSAVGGQSALECHPGFPCNRLLMTRVIFNPFIGLVLLTLVFSATCLFPRPPRNAADLLEPILDARIHADDSDFSHGPPNWKLEQAWMVWRKTRAPPQM